jgi:hypothetical protein
MLFFAAPGLMLLALGFAADAGWFSEAHDTSDPEHALENGSRTSVRTGIAWADGDCDRPA